MTDADFEANLTCCDPVDQRIPIDRTKTDPTKNLKETGSYLPHGAETGTPPTSRARETRILAIDPGTTESGWCYFDGEKVLGSGVSRNEDVLMLILAGRLGESVAIEMIASYGMAVGREVFETCVWIGRFVQANVQKRGYPPQLIYRRDVKLHLCGNPRAKDANIRVALIDLIGPQGTKKAPGPTYGVKSHAWAALGVAVTAAHQIREAA